MQLSQIPTLVPLPFANSGSKNVIPTASQIGITSGAASLTDGFPPLTYTPLTAGGVPPSAQDFNGILNLLSANTQWENAGGFYTYNATFSTAIGGYPKSALLAKASGVGYWLASVDNLATDPDTGGAGWIDFSPSAIQNGAYSYAADTGTANTYAITLTPAPLAITPGMIVGISAIVAANTGASTFNLNGLGALPIQGPGAAALQGGEFVAGGSAILQANAGATAWNLIWTSGAQPVASATKANQAVNLGQFLGPVTNGATLGSLAISSTYTKTVSFTAPAAGFVWGQARSVISGVASSNITTSLLINGTSYQVDQTIMPMTDCGTVQVTQGEAMTITAQLVTGSASPGVAASLYVDAIFIPSLTN